ncbi:MarR family winged helix-turn-helix transcriptional regulator [Paenibacillus sp. J31TS4]|uniref:MarR family winged helix-turn-helix transcriptional regulator n=1 Tax=Paenibacillus sp. J31TS4 TaxID=2807195 RepID=UPI001BD16364|nr:MarR family transcriptional regulator [Paenibacillus sp. J31TS4]
MTNESRLKSWIERYEAAHFLIGKRLDAMMREQLGGELTIEQFSILRYMKRRGRTTSTELADAFCVGKSAITAIITRLVDKSLIARVQDQEDRRVVYLELTDEGYRIEEIADEKVQANVGKYLATFPEDEIEGFMSCFERLAALMVEDSEGRGTHE